MGWVYIVGTYHIVRIVIISGGCDCLLRSTQRFFWLDYFAAKTCLSLSAGFVEQCLPDFQPDAIVELVRDIGCFANVIDEEAFVRCECRCRLRYLNVAVCLGADKKSAPTTHISNV